MSETLVEKLPPIHAKNSHGRDKVWIARILTNSHGHGIYEIEHGQEGGKLQLTRRVITEGKNLGKKNETTALVQCTNEIFKKWNDKQTKEGYGFRVTTTEAATKSPPTVIYPMLAQTYTRDTKSRKKNDIVYPCFVQPKLDGLRCLIYIHPTTGEVITQSRTGGYFGFLGHITEYMKRFLERFPNIVFDGELYTKDIPFETLAGLIKKKNMSEADLEEITKVKYHIYDFIDKNNASLTYIQRDEFLNRLYEETAGTAAAPVEFVETYLVHTQDQFYEKFQEFIENGYEGAMLRNSAGVYKQKYRSHDLQKYKEFFEDEYEIVGFSEGAGRDEGTVIWECITPEGKRFNVRPKGSIEYRSELFENADKLIGKNLTVIFQELTDMGVPRFPVGKSIREGF